MGCPNARGGVGIVEKKNLRANQILTPSVITTTGIAVGVALVVPILVGWPHLLPTFEGDISEEDDDGYVTITGRIKELIITAGGENIPPIIIENEIKSVAIPTSTSCMRSPTITAANFFWFCRKELPHIVSNVMVVGDRRKFLTCLITLKCQVCDLITKIVQWNLDNLHYCAVIFCHAFRAGGP